MRTCRLSRLVCWSRDTNISHDTGWTMLTYIITINLIISVVVTSANPPPPPPPSTDVDGHEDPEITRTSGDTCSNTYYIHEYHNHVNHSSMMGNTVIEEDEAIRELEGELLVERSKRLHQMEDFMRWMRMLSRSDLGDNNEMNRRFEEMLDDVGKMLQEEKESSSSGKKKRRRKKQPVTVLQQPERIHNDNAGKEAFNSQFRSSSDGNDVVKQHDEAAYHGNQHSNQQDNKQITAVQILQVQVTDLNNEVTTMRRHYLHLYKQNKRLFRKNNDVLDRHHRLKMYTADSAQRLVWKLHNETELWRTSYNKLEEKLSCLIDPRKENCSHVIQSADTANHNAGNGHVTQGGGNQVAAKNMKGGKSGEVLKESLVEANEGNNHGAGGMSREVPGTGQDTPGTRYEALVGRKTEVLQGDGAGLVEAGVQVSAWYLEQQRAQRPKDCGDLDYWVQREKPVQTVYMRNRTLPVRVLCEEGWTIVYRYTFDQNKYEKTPPRTWKDYKYGFGSLSSNLMWMGLEYLHWLSQQDDYVMMIELVKAVNGFKLEALYSFVDIASEKDWYRLQVSDFAGSASGDLLGVSAYTPVTGNPFSTWDRASSGGLGKMANEYETGWWYTEPGDAGFKSRESSMELPEPCFTQLLHEMPWYCDEQGTGHHLSHITIKLMPSRKT